MICLSLSWEDLDPYVFPPVPLLSILVNKILSYNYKSVILIAPGRSNMLWFWDHVMMSSEILIPSNSAQLIVPLIQRKPTQKPPKSKSAFLLRKIPLAMCWREQTSTTNSLQNIESLLSKNKAILTRWQ